MKDGHINKCKECARADVLSYRNENLEKVRKNNALGARNPKRRLAIKKYSKTTEGKNSRRRSSKKWLTKNPHKKRAYNTVSRALFSGKIIKKPCEVCKKIKSEAHHDDYSKPLSVRWLCKAHHAEHHRKYKD